MRIDTGRLRVVGGEALEPPQAQDGTPPSPGTYIREHRERRGMSLEELAAATKVPKDSLQLVEADRFSELPGMVFAKGFLRCCARVLDLDEDTVLGLMYEQERLAPADADKRTRVRRETGDGLVVPASQVPSAPLIAAAPAPEPETVSAGSSMSESSANPGVGLMASAGDATASAASTNPETGSAASTRRAAQAPVSFELPQWALRLRERVTAPRLLLWLLVAAFVVLIVFLAFTIASGQRGGDLRL